MGHGVAFIAEEDRHGRLSSRPVCGPEAYDVPIPDLWEPSL